MVRALFDTNILIDFLRGMPQAAEEVARHERPAISIVTWMEVMAGAPQGTEKATRAFLAAYEVLDVDPDVAERAVALRRKYRLKFPDAVILASAQEAGMLLVTRDDAFPADDPGVRFPYRL